MFTLVILYTPVYIVCTHVYPSNTGYPVNPYISCVPMFTLVILFTMDTPIYPVHPCLPSSTVYPVYPCISFVYIFFPL